MDKKLSIIKELDVSNIAFNLKSSSTGRYSLHDSYKENYENGFLKNLNAPADVSIALKNIYYATEKGLVISYREFNNKIIKLRNQILETQYHNRSIQELSIEERAKIERESSKQISKSLSISETTKLIYSQELTELRREFSEQKKKIKLKYKDQKVLFIEVQDELEIIEEKEIEQQEELSEEVAETYEAFIEKNKPLIQKALGSYNLDEIELCLVALNDSYNNLPELAKTYKVINNFYDFNKENLTKESLDMKKRQDEYEKLIDNRVSQIIKSQAFSKIKVIINAIEEEFKNNRTIHNDIKSNSIKEAGINKLTSIAKALALIPLKEWDSPKMEMALELLEENLPQEISNLLEKKYQQEQKKLKVKESNISKINTSDSKQLLEKFKEFDKQKELFEALFKNIDVEKFLSDLETEYISIITLFAKNLNYENFKLFWSKFPEKINIEIASKHFPYQGFESNKRNFYFNTLALYASESTLESFVKDVESRFVKDIDADTAINLLLRMSFLDIENFAKKIRPDILFEISKMERISEKNFVKDTVITCLVKWILALEPSSTLFDNIMRTYSKEFVYRITKDKITKMELKQILELIEIIQDDRITLEHLILKTGKEIFDKVLKMKYQFLVEEEPESLENHYILGISFVETGELDFAIEEFNKCKEIDSDKSEIYYNLGLCYDKKGDTERAIIEYKNAIKRKYEFPEAHYNIAVIYSKEKDKFLAIQAFKKVIKLDPNNYNAHVNLGMCYDEINDIDSAILEYERAIESNPKKFEAYLNLGVDWTIKGNEERAIICYEKAIGIDPENSKVQFNLALLYQQKGDFNRAIAHYKLAIRYGSENSDIYNNLGLSYFAKKNFEKAIEMWKKSIEIDDNIDAYNNLGWGYNTIGDIDSALRTYLKAKTISQDHQSLSLNLGTVYYRVNEYEKAIAELENYLKLSSDSDKNFEVAKIIKKIKDELNSTED